MPSFKYGAYKSLSLLCFLLLTYWNVSDAKLSDEKIKENMTSAESGGSKLSSGSALLFADELKQTLEKYLFGMCPQTFKSRWSQMPIGARSRNNSTMTCDVDAEQHDLPGRLAALSLRAHAASRAECVRLGTALANTLGELARTAANRQASVNEANKKRKLSKSQKAKIQAKQRTALAVKKKAASVAAAAAAKIGTA